MRGRVSQSSTRDLASHHLLAFSAMPVADDESIQVNLDSLSLEALPVPLRSSRLTTAR